MSRRASLLFAVCVLATCAVPTSDALPATDNGQIAFTHVDSSGHTFVYTANPDGTRAQRLIARQACCPGWSHDGARLAIPVGISGGRIGTATVSATGTHYKVLPLSDKSLNAGCNIWSPIGRTLACETWDDKHSDRNGVYTLSASAGGALTRVTTNPYGGHDLPGGYSPDGKRLVFTRFQKNGTGIGLYVVNADGTGEHRITPGGTVIQDGNSGDWSPASDLIVFSRHVAGPGSIWVIHATGRGLRQIHTQGLVCGGSAGCHEPRWSPDGHQILFARNAGRGANLYTVNADGTGLERITQDGAADNPAWGSHPPRA